MEINFNNLRKQTAYSLDRVIKVLNDGILPETEFAGYKQADGKYQYTEGNVLIKKEHLQKHLDELRSNIWALLCIY